MHLPFVLTKFIKNKYIIINITAIFLIFAAVLLKKLNKNLIFILYTECTTCLNIALWLEKAG